MPKRTVATMDTNMGGDSKQLLTKFLQEEQLASNNIGWLVNYLLDPEPDELNPDGYSIEDRKQVDGTRAWMRDAENNPNQKIEIYSLSDDPNQKKGPYTLDTMIRDRSSDLIKVGVEVLDGQEIPYQTIDLLVEKTIGGAAKR